MNGNSAREPVGVGEFGKVATGLSRNPLGIIALFIVLVYGMAALVTMFGADFSGTERLPLIVFLTLFPVIVLGAFIWIVRDPRFTYAPSDFKSDDGYLQMIALLAASAAKQSDGGNKQIDPAEIVGAAKKLYPKAQAVQRAPGKSRVLWVDDRPANNTYLSEAFKKAGLLVDEALNTGQALAMLDQDSYDVIISDMARNEGAQEGYALLEEVRRKGLNIPFFIFSSSGAKKHRQMAIDRGAQGATNDGQELFDDVLTAVKAAE